MNTVVLISSFILGLGGSLHCLGMCGPLALSVPFTQKESAKWQRIIIFYLSKSVAYGMLGAIFGLFGKGLILMNWQQGLSITAGVFIILLVCLPVLKPVSGKFLFQKQFATLYTQLQKRPRLQYYSFLGFLNGLLPCGLVYTALAAATLSGGWSGGFLAMFLFGLGTVPAFVLLILFRNKMGPGLRKQLKPVSITLSVCIGLLLVLRGLNLGIPYVSPGFQEHKVSCCGHPEGK